LLVAVACGGDASDDKDHDHDHDHDHDTMTMTMTDTNPSEVMTDAGLYRIHLTPSSDDFTSGVEVMLDMHVMADDMGVAGATVTVTPFMPDMGHGLDTPPVVTEDDMGMGMYTATWTYTMAGLWEVDIEVDSTSGVDMATVAYKVE